jgi:hypothetical protein
MHDVVPRNLTSRTSDNCSLVLLVMKIVRNPFLIGLQLS